MAILCDGAFILRAEDIVKHIVYARISVMREIRFLWKIILFSLPLTVVLGFLVWVFYRSGELTSDDEMVSRQMSNAHPVLIGLAYSNPTAYINLKSVLVKSPEIIVLGSSRVSQFRSGFFTSSTTAYTVSSLQKITHLRHFLEKIPVNQNPKVIIVGLDQRFFNPNYDSLVPDNIDDLLTRPVSWVEPFTMWLEAYRDLFQGKLRIADIMHATDSAIGVSAIVDGSGYRNDGSHESGVSSYTVQTTFPEVDQEINGFEHSADISEPALRELGEFLDECRARNIYVVGFVPPFSPGLYAKILSLHDAYGYYEFLSPDLGAIFKSHGFAFSNFTDPQSLHLTEADMSDAMHTTERGSLILFTKMVETNAVLRQYADAHVLERQLSTAKGKVSDLFGR